MIDRLRSLFRNPIHSGESKRPAARSKTSIGQSVGTAAAGLLQRLLESRFLTAILSPLSRLIGAERVQRHRGLAMELVQRLREGRIGLGIQLYIGIGGAVAITLSASLVAWFSFNQVGDAQNRVNEDSIPEMTAAFGLARQAGTLVAAAPRLVTAATPADFTGVAAAVAKEQTDFETRLQALIPRKGEEEKVSRILANGSEIISNIGAIRDSVSESFVLSERSEELLTTLEGLQDELTVILVPAIDDHYFYALTGYRNLRERPASPARHFAKAEFNRYRHIPASGGRHQSDGNPADRAGSGALRVGPRRHRAQPRGSRYGSVAGKDIPGFRPAVGSGAGRTEWIRSACTGTRSRQ